MIERDPRLPAPAPSASALHGEPGLTVAEVEEALGLEVKTKPEPLDDRHGRRPAWVMALLAMGLVVGVIAIGFIKFVKGPVSAGAVVATPTATVRVAAAKTGSSVLGGDYFELTYPGVFDQVGKPQKDNVALEQYMLSSKGDPRRTIAISVRPLSSSNLNDDPSYRIRLIHPQDYKLRQEKLAGENVSVMLRNDNTEATFFWAHLGKVLTISATTSNPADSVEDYIKAIEPTVRWRS